MARAPSPEQRMGETSKLGWRLLKALHHLQEFETLAGLQNQVQYEKQVTPGPLGIWDQLSPVRR